MKNTQFRSVVKEQQYEDDEQEYIRKMEALKVKMTQCNTEKLKNILTKTYQMQECGNNVNVNLKGQTQKLQNINTINNDTGMILKKANETSKQMASFWYSLGKSIKRVFVKESDEIQTKKPNKSAYQDGTNSQNIQNASNKRNEFQKVAQSTQNQDPHDAFLDQITNQTRKLKSIMHNTNKQIDKQTGLIDEAHKGMDKNSNKIEEINKRIKRNFF